MLIGNYRKFRKKETVELEQESEEDHTPLAARLVLNIDRFSLIDMLHQSSKDAIKVHYTHDATHII